MDKEIQESKGSMASSRKSCYFAEMALRILVIAFSLAGAVTTVTSRQSVTVFGIIFAADYSYSASFRYKVVADTVVCGLTVLSVILVISLNRHQSSPKYYFYLLLLDLACLLLLLSGSSAAVAIGWVGKFGQDQTGWIPICDRVGKFCDKMTGSIVLSFLAVFCLFVLTVMSAHKLQSQPFYLGNPF